MLGFSAANERQLTSQHLKIIADIANKLGDDLRITGIQENRTTARARKTVIVDGEKGKYFIELAVTSLQRFYLTRAIRKARRFKKTLRQAVVPLPLMAEEINGVFVAVHAFLEGQPSRRDFSGEIILKELYDHHSFKTPVTASVTKRITRAFLASWPKEYHFFIQNLPEYSDYLVRLSGYREIILCPEHGDFAWNNLLDCHSGKNLIDFEFSREDQPAGFDLYYYNLTTHKSTLWWRKKYYYKNLHALKLKLIHTINFAIDHGFSDVILYHYLPDSIKTQLNGLLRTSHDFRGLTVDELLPAANCPSASLYFLTLWEGEKITGFAAFKKAMNVLTPLIASNHTPMLQLNKTGQFSELLHFIEKSGFGLYLPGIHRGAGLYSQMEAVVLHKFQPHKSARQISLSHRDNGKIRTKFFIEKFARLFRQGSRYFGTFFIYLEYRTEIRKLAEFIYYYPKIRWRWRKSRKKGGALLLHVGNFPVFIAALNKNNIDYVVLRGLKKGGVDGGEDIDFLLNAAHIQKVIRIASFFPGTMPCDFYFDTMQSVECYPYYPPSFALQILENKTLSEFGCYVPSAHFHLLSLLYHITYHKGLGSGFGIEDSEPSTKPKHWDTIIDLKKATGQEKTIPMNLVGFHAFLKRKGFSMPFDLLVKWPIRHTFLDFLRDREKNELLALLPHHANDLMIFLIRDDVTEAEIIEYIHKEISSSLKVLLFEKLTRDQIDRALQMTRGGNWIEEDKKIFHKVAPSHILICIPQKPFQCHSTTPGEDHKQHQEKCSAIKNQLRHSINKNFPSKIQRYALHSSDSPAESIDYIKVIYQDNYGDLLEKLQLF